MTHELVLVDISCLKLPGDGPTLDERMASEHVEKLAASMRDPDVGELAPPIVDGNTMEVLDGGDRVAAHHLAGHTHVEVSIRRPGPRARQKLLLAGNALRRHEPERQAREQRRLYELKLADEIEAEQHGRMQAHLEAIGRAPGRPSTARGRAIRKTAEALGKKPEAVRKAIERHEKRLEALRNAPIYEGELLEHEFLDATYTVDCLGETMPEVTEVEIAILKRYLWKAQLMLSRSASMVNAALEKGYGLSEHHTRAWMRDALELRERLELIAPAMICMPCRGSGCQDCDARGWLDGIGG